MYKFVRLEVNQNNQKEKGSLGFPTLITALCVAHGVKVNPKIKIRPSIDQKFIVHNCTITEEQPLQTGDAPVHHSLIHQPGSSSSMEALMLEEMSGLCTTIERMQLDQRVT